MLARHRTRPSSLSLIIAMTWLLTGALAACSGSDDDGDSGADGTTGQGDVTTDSGTSDGTNEDTAEDVAGPTGACEGRAGCA